MSEDRFRPAGRVYCSCGHEIQLHRPTCPMQNADGSECQCQAAKPELVMLVESGAVYRLVPFEDDRRSDSAKGEVNSKS